MPYLWVLFVVASVRVSPVTLHSLKRDNFVDAWNSKSTTLGPHHLTGSIVSQLAPSQGSLTSYHDQPTTLSLSSHCIAIMEEEGPSRKRSRMMRCKALWFEDGNLIIIIDENKSCRVYQAILAERSPVFRDLLALPPPPESETMYGCRVLRLSDSPDEFGMFLLAIFDSEYV